jgi:hypothetical protein
LARRSLDGVVIPAQAISTAVEGSPSGGLFFHAFLNFYSDHLLLIGTDPFAAPFRESWGDLQA